MPKNNVVNGPTIEKGEEEECLGDSSLTSSEKSPSKDDSKNQPLPKPVPMTGNRSSKARRGNYIVPSTDTDLAVSDE